MLAFVALLAVLAGAPAKAGAVAFGPDLGNAPNNAVTCGEGVPPLYLYDVGSPSCMYFSGAPGPSPTRR
jgi:hypothetical protein